MKRLLWVRHCVFHELSHLILQQPFKLRTLLISQTMKYIENRKVFQVQVANKWWIQELTVSSLILEPILLNFMVFYFVKLRDPNEKWKIHGDFTALNKEKLFSKKSAFSHFPTWCFPGMDEGALIYIAINISHCPKYQRSQFCIASYAFSHVSL